MNYETIDLERHFAECDIQGQDAIRRALNELETQHLLATSGGTPRGVDLPTMEAAIEAVKKLLKP